MPTALALGLDPQLVLLAEARLHDPYACLGARHRGDGWSVRAYNPHARAAAVATADGWIALPREAVAGLFEARLGTRPASPCRLRFEEGNATRECFDPYSFPLTLSEDDLYLFGAGRLHQAYLTLGAQPMTLEGVAGVRFAVWAPNAERVSVVGDFNRCSGAVGVKSDPYAQSFELRPATALRISRPAQHAWGDGAWLERRACTE